MGKLPIIPRSDTRDNARKTSKEEKVTTATAAVIVGSAVSRSSAVNSAIADSAAADHDCRLHVVGDVDNDPRQLGDISARRCAGRRSTGNQLISEIADYTETISGVVGASSDPARWRWRDVVGAARLRRNTWHADRPGGESAVEVANIGVRRDVSNVQENRVYDVLRARRWNVRIAGDDRTCCATDVAPPHAQRPRDRVIRAGSNSNGRVIERRIRRNGGTVLARSRSIGAPINIPETDQILHGTVGSITIINTEREGRNRFSVALVVTADVSECDGNILPKDAINKVSEHADANSRSLITVFKSRESISNTECVGGSLIAGSRNTISESSPHRSGSVTRLIEIGIADSSDAKRPRCLVEEVANGTTAPSSSVEETIARLVADESRPRRTKTDTCWRLPATRIGFVLRTLLLGLLAKSLFCDAVLGAPSSFSADLNDPIVFEDSVEQELVMPGNDLRESELEIIRRSIVQGLGLQRIPDASKVSLVSLNYLPRRRVVLDDRRMNHDSIEELSSNFECK